MRPVVRVVLLKDPFGAAEVPALGDVSVETEFDLTLPDDDWAELSSGYFRAVSGRVSTLSPDIVIVRRAGASKQQGWSAAAAGRRGRSDGRGSRACREHPSKDRCGVRSRIPPL